MMILTFNLFPPPLEKHLPVCYIMNAYVCNSYSETGSLAAWWLMSSCIIFVQQKQLLEVIFRIWQVSQKLPATLDPTLMTLEQEEMHFPIRIILLCTHIKLLGKPLSQAVLWTLASRCQDTITTALTPCEERVIPEANHAVSQQNDFVYSSFSGFGC